MRKEQLFAKWTVNPDFKADLEAVIATEITKAQIEKTKETRKIEIDDYTLSEIRRAFMALREDKNSYIYKVFSDDSVFYAMNKIEKAYNDYFGKKTEETPYANAQEAQPNPELNPIEQAYKHGEAIRIKSWPKEKWIKKYSDSQAIDDNCIQWRSIHLSFWQTPEDWEIYTEPTKQPSSQAKLDNSLDRERFEAMFRAVVASGVKLNFYFCKQETTYFIQQLDAYYATKDN